MTAAPPPVPALFQKPQLASLKISPRGTYLAWLERDPATKVLNLRLCFAADAAAVSRPPARLTSYRDRDACAHFLFSADERHLLYVREPVPGREMYHLYSVDVAAALRGPTDPVDRTPARDTTCCLGFVGGIQLFASAKNPNEVLLATGRGSFFWDVSRLRLEENELLVEERHVLGGVLEALRRHKEQPWRRRGKAIVSELVSLRMFVVLVRLLLNLGMSYCGAFLDAACFASIAMFAYLVKLHPLDDFYYFQPLLQYRIEPPRFPVEWFADEERGEIRGFAGVSLELPRPAEREETPREKFRSATDLLRRRLWIAPQIHVSFVAKDGSGRWRALHSIRFDDLNMQLPGAGGGTGKMRMDFVHSSDGSFVDVHACRPEKDTTQYERYDLNTGKLVKVLASSKDSDVTGFVECCGRVCGVVFEKDYEEIEMLEEFQENGGTSNGANKNFLGVADIAFLEKIVGPGIKFELLSSTSDGSTFVVHVYSDRANELCANTPSGYFLYRRGARPSQNSLRLFPGGIPHPQLAAYESFLGTQRPLQIRARDGLEVPCYLTLPAPRAVADRTRVPLVVFPHGGPQSRDSWGYNPPSQLLASRGLAVLTVNYRGSTGYGHAFMAHGMDGECARRTQEDILDAVLAVLAREFDGLVLDPRRVALLGASFGGYCSAFHLCRLGEASPVRFVGGVVVASLLAAGRLSAEQFRGDPLIVRYWRRVFGAEISDDVAAAKKVSPLCHSERIEGRLLVVHGEEDPRCPVEMADRFWRAFEESHGAKEGDGGSAYIRYRGEGHGIRKEENVLHMWWNVEQFLCRCLLGSKDRNLDSVPDFAANHTGVVKRLSKLSE